MNATITLEGMEAAQRALRKAGGTSADAKSMNKKIVDSVIVPEARRQVPSRSGKLKATIDSDATAVFGYILAGARGDVEYAGVIHFGWSSRGLGALAGGSAAQRRKKLKSALGASRGNELTSRATNKAARKGVRGGPIAPQPFIYDAIDARQGEVFEAYERQLEHRFEIEGLL